MKKTLLFLALTALFVSCDRVETHVFKSFIASYKDYKDIVLDTARNGSIAIKVVDMKHICGWRSKGKEKDLYNSLCREYNDISYNQKIRFIAAPELPACYASSFEYINITSNAAYDDEHPAGSSLGDIVRLLSASPYPYIQSGYRDRYTWEDFPEIFKKNNIMPQYYYDEAENTMFPVNKLLSEFAPEDLMLMDISWNTVAVLVFDKQPVLSKEHEFTVNIKLNDGREFNPKLKMIFS